MKQPTPLRPSKIVAKQYSRDIKVLVRAMQKSVERELKKNLAQSARPAMDADSVNTPNKVGKQMQLKLNSAAFRQTVGTLRSKYESIFQKLGRVAAYKWIEKQSVYASNSFISSVKKVVENHENPLNPFEIKGQMLTPENSEMMRAAIKENVSLIKSVSSKYFDRIETAILNEMKIDGNKESLLRTLQKIGGMSERQADLIARDQTSKIYGQILVDKMRDVGLSKIKWLHSSAGKEPRSYHQTRWDGVSEPPNGLNGYVFNIDNPPIIDLKTGERGIPGQLINCFPEDTLIYSHPKLIGASRRFYKGKMVSLKTKSGQVITATPNHPILTSRGWVRIGEVSKSDDIFCNRLGVKKRPSVFANFNKKNPPSTIKEIFESVSNSAVGSRVAGSIMDFHGDGMKTDVDVVVLKSLLVDRSVKKLRNSLLSKSVVLKRLLPRYSSFGKFFRGSCHSSNRLMSFEDLIKSFFFAHRIPFKKIRLASRSALNIIFSKNPSDYVSGNSEEFGDAVLRLRKNDISIDYVTSVNVFDFFGHVYNLHTVDGWYSVTSTGNTQGIIAHNCRCASLPVVEF